MARSETAFFLPEPWMMVVESFETTTRLAWPKCSAVTLSSGMPSSSVIAVPPVSAAMSSR